MSNSPARYRRSSLGASRLALALVLATLSAVAGCTTPTRASEVAPAAVASAWTVVGSSVGDRPIEAQTLGAGPYRVYLIGGIHGDEHEGGQWIDRLCDDLAARPELLAGVTLRVLRDANPDGTAGFERTNAHGVDLNRNFPASNFAPAPARGDHPLSEPEIEAVHADFVAFDPELAVVLHASRRGPFVNFDGPSESLARYFADAARNTDARWHTVPDMGYPTPGSFGSWAGKDLALPVLTVEFERGQDADSAWRALSAGTLALLERAAR